QGARADRAGGHHRHRARGEALARGQRLGPGDRRPVPARGHGDERPAGSAPGAPRPAHRGPEQPFLARRALALPAAGRGRGVRQVAGDRGAGGVLPGPARAGRGLTLPYHGLRTDAEAHLHTDILALGEPMVEFNQAAGGGGRTYLQGFGGDTSNAAIAAARQGARVGYVSAVGDDPYGAMLRALWRGEGVDDAEVRTDAEGFTAVYFVTHDARGHHFS